MSAIDFEFFNNPFGASWSDVVEEVRHQLGLDRPSSALVEQDDEWDQLEFKRDQQ